MTIQVLLVDNVSAEPFRQTSPAFEMSIREAPPAIAWRIARAGEADMALLPVAKISEVADQMESIGHYGVACTGAVGSVLLMSRHPLKNLLKMKARIYLAPESETSNLLLNTLWRNETSHCFDISSDLETSHAQLVIGNRALHERFNNSNWPYTIDLCEWWYRQTSMPFVFARWTVRRTLSKENKEAAEKWLDQCSLNAKTKCGLERMACRTTQSGLFPTTNHARVYFQGLTSRFGKAERCGEAAFLSAVGKYVY